MKDNVIFIIILLKILTLPLIVSGCLRVVTTSLDFIWRKYNFRSHSKLSRLNGFRDFKIGRIATFPLDSIMYEGMELAFNQDHQALYVPRCW
jgi:hypothetical protein